ncbi:hypothetical protein BJF93_17690 [Xaviernesmea oryzae]|uniref:Uncharacterized protein n=1 Tax=Xaviernesmea oryzae TaxID=464029 RepID=A0A1Q9ATA6_9HYPH|nr:hypothetical protein BJF93_17690 [Xaviernesmea oryzae]
MLLNLVGDAIGLRGARPSGQDFGQWTIDADEQDRQAIKPGHAVFQDAKWAGIGLVQAKIGNDGQAQRACAAIESQSAR